MEIIGWNSRTVDKGIKESAADSIGWLDVRQPSNRISTATKSNPPVGECAMDLTSARTRTAVSCHVEVPATCTSTATTTASRPEFLAPSVRSAAWPARSASSSTPHGRAVDASRGRWSERPDSALSNLSELDSGYDELRSFTITPLLPPELIITGPSQFEESHPLHVLPVAVTSSFVSSDEENEGNDAKRDVSGDKSISDASASDLCRSEALLDDHCNVSEHDLLSARTGTGTRNSSALSLSSVDAADNAESDVDVPSDDVAMTRSPSDTDDQTEAKDSLSSDNLHQAANKLLSDVCTPRLSSKQSREDLGTESERSSLSPVEDEATTSRLELFQISAFTESQEMDRERSISREKSPCSFDDNALIDQRSKYPVVDETPGDVRLSNDQGRDNFEDDQLDWKTVDDGELGFRCSSALGDRTPPRAGSAHISTGESPQWRTSPDEESPHVGHYDVIATACNETSTALSPRDTETRTNQQACRGLETASDIWLSEIGHTGTKLSQNLDGLNKTEPQNSDCLSVASCRQTVCPQSGLDTIPLPVPVAGSYTEDEVRVARRSQRRDRLYGSQRCQRRRSPHPRSVYRLSLPQQPRSGFWQPWQSDNASSGSVDDAPSLQTALENLRRLSMLTKAGFHRSSSASAMAGAATSADGLGQSENWNMSGRNPGCMSQYGTRGCAVTPAWSGRPHFPPVVGGLSQRPVNPASIACYGAAVSSVRAPPPTPYPFIRPTPPSCTGDMTKSILVRPLPPTFEELPPTANKPSPIFYGSACHVDCFDWKQRHHEAVSSGRLHYEMRSDLPQFCSEAVPRCDNTSDYLDDVPAAVPPPWSAVTRGYTPRGSGSFSSTTGQQTWHVMDSQGHDPTY